MKSEPQKRTINLLNIILLRKRSEMERRENSINDLLYI